MIKKIKKIRDNCLISLFDLKINQSGVYDTQNCIDLPKKSNTTKVENLIYDGVQKCTLDDGSIFVRKTNFLDDWLDWTECNEN